MTKIAIHNVETDEVIEREMTAEELIQWQKDKIEIEQSIEEVENRKVARLAVFAKLGLTEAEIQAIS
jgi:U3 small nucleolar ribonucleoprotein component